jgi:uncharacterized protein (TIGR00251 family)
VGAVSWRREEGDALVLALHVQPGAKRTEVAGVHGDALKIRLAAPPVDGRANAELIRFLAEVFGVPLRNVTLLRGETSRVKHVRIVGPTRRPDWAARSTARPPTR